MESDQIATDPVVEADDAIFEACLEAAEYNLISETIGYFGPDSVAWQVFREPVILLGGYRAIMLQVAHPAVAQGVEQSSSFRNDIIGRARRTIQAMNSLIFGSKDQALKAARTMHMIHHRVKGIVPENIESSWAGQPFRANDLILKNWVGLTTIDAVIDYFEKFVRPLSSAELDRLADEIQTLAYLCGLPDAYHYDSIAALREKRNKMLSGDELTGCDIACGIIRDLFETIPGSLDQRITYGMLPEQARKLYQIDWSAQDQQDYERLSSKISFLNRSLPKSIRYIPAWNQAQNRISQVKTDGEEKAFRLSLFQKGREQTAGLYMRLLGISGEQSEQTEA